MFQDTIFALSSGGVPSGVAVIRLSGRHVRFVFETMTGSVPPARLLRYGAIKAVDGRVLDRGMAAFFPGPSSFSGEDCGEIHLHGSRAVVDAVLAELSAFEGVRAAEAGEFTRRAFLNGKLDLTEAEGLADLISAETEIQRRVALANASGQQKSLYRGWRDLLLHIRAMIEAELDFSDEEDVPGSVTDTIWDDARALVREIDRHIDGFQRAELIRDGFRVVLVGAPNAGKSSLLNALARRDAAIVTDEPGTTRDPVEVTMNLGGCQVILTDTAGIRENAGKVEAIGIDRARARAADAHLVLSLVDLVNPVALEVASDVPVLRIGTKTDLVGEDRNRMSNVDHSISVVSGVGLEPLLERMTQIVTERIGKIGSVLPSRRRHIDLLQEARSRTAEASEMSGRPLELRAEELRLASDALGRISGSVDVEDLLDVIFSQFCIGK